MTVWDDGTGPALFVGGGFDTAGGVIVNRIAKWDGIQWHALQGPTGTGVSNAVLALTTFDDGSGEALVVGGAFVFAGGVLANSVAKWDGSAWSALSGPSGTGVNSIVRALAAWDDGSGTALYAGGVFTSAGGVAANGVAKWDGSGWSALSGPSGNGVDSAIYALTAWDDGGGIALYAGGQFTTAGGVAANNVAKWSGAAWSALTGPTGTGVDNAVYALTTWDDGSGDALYAGGQFIAAGGVSAGRVARWDGSTWSPLAGPLGAGLNGPVNVLTVYDNGSGSALYAGGNFWSAGGVAVNDLAMWDGGAWAAVPGASGTEWNGIPSALAVWDEGGVSALYVGGNVTSAGGVPVNFVARLLNDDWSALSNPAGDGTNSSVLAFTVWDDGGGPAVYAGGLFTRAGGEAVNRVAKWDGNEWAALAGPSGTGVDGAVSALTVYDDGGGSTLVVGGQFTTAGGVTVNHVAKWDGSNWSALSGPSGTGTDGAVHALTTWDDGSATKLYAGGQFTTAGGVAVNRVAAWSGSGWSALSGPMGTGTDNRVLSLAVWDDGGGGALFVGGDFIAAGGVAANRVAKWDGSDWSALSGPSGIGVAGGSVAALALWDDGGGNALYAGGGFTVAGGVTVDRVAKWDGSGWSALEGPSGTGVSGPVSALTTWDEGEGVALYAGGSFLFGGGNRVNNVARWDGSAWSALASPVGLGTNGGVLALAVREGESGDELFVGGNFGVAGGIASTRVGKYTCSEMVDTTLPMDPVVDWTSPPPSAWSNDTTVDILGCSR